MPETTNTPAPVTDIDTALNESLGKALEIEPAPEVPITDPAPEAEPTEAELLMAEFMGDDEDADSVEAAPEFLIPLRQVRADTMPLVVGEIEDPDTGETITEGQTYFIQKGKNVWILPTTGFAAMFSTAGLLMGGKKQSAKAMIDAMTTLCKRVSELVARWDLIDVAGQPLPQPYRDHEVIMNLTEDQLAWLLDKLTSRETKEERGNA